MSPCRPSVIASARRKTFLGINRLVNGGHWSYREAMKFRGDVQRQYMRLQKEKK